MDTEYLLKDRYDAKMRDIIREAPRVLVSDTPAADSKIEYTDMRSFQGIARQLGIMDDEKAGVPRTAYMGVVSVAWKGHYLHIAPKDGVTHYKT